MNIKMMYITYIQTANILIVSVISRRHALEICPQMLHTCHCANLFPVKPCILSQQSRS